MENSKIAFKVIISNDSTYNNKIKCFNCGGTGNYKTPESSRRTCIVCFGKAYINCV